MILKLHEAIEEHVSANLKKARARGDSSCVLVSGDIHQEMALNNRMPSVCRVMYQLMGPDDQILNQTQSTFSSTIKINYLLR